MGDRHKIGPGLQLFKPGTPQKDKVKAIFFFTLLTLIIFAQAFYWLFANKVFPIIWGMPLGLFTVVMLIVAEFVVLTALYFSDKGIK
jgi:phosphoglycerol transferase MdoB-like AlkP superfamily enzyme